VKTGKLNRFRSRNRKKNRKGGGEIDFFPAIEKFSNPKKGGERTRREYARLDGKKDGAGLGTLVTG